MAFKQQQHGRSRKYYRRPTKIGEEYNLLVLNSKPCIRASSWGQKAIVHHSKGVQDESLATVGGGGSNVNITALATTHNKQFDNGICKHRTVDAIFVKDLESTLEPLAFTGAPNAKLFL